MKKFNEFVSLSERPLTKGEEDKKEDIVKGMKKDKKGFEDRYGDNAQSVMYATATKLAKEDVTLQDADGNDFLEVVDLIKPDPIKGVATEQKELEPKKNPEPTVDQEPSKDKGNAEIKKNDKGNAELKKKEKKVNMMKRMILMKKMQAVRAGAGMDIVAHHEPEEEMVEGDYHSGQGEKIQKRTLEWMRKKGIEGAPGLDAIKARQKEHEEKRRVKKEEFVDEGARRPSELKSRAKLEALLKRKEDLKKKQKVAEGIVDMVKKGAKRHAKAIEKKKIKNRKAVPYAALGASYEPEGEVIDEADPRLAIYQSGMTDASRVKGPVGKAVDKVKDKVKKVLGKKDKVSSHLDRYRFQSGLDNYLKSKVKKEEVELDERLGGKGYKPYTSLTGRRVSGDWEGSDRGGGHKWQKRVGKPVEKKSPTYLAHVHNKGKKKIDPKKNPVVEDYVIEKEDSPYEKASSGALKGKTRNTEAKEKEHKTSFRRKAHRNSAAMIIKAKRKAERSGKKLSDDDAADLAHKGWASSVKHHKSSMTPEQQKRRQKLADTPYKKLSKDEQDKDKVSAKAIKDVHDKQKKKKVNEAKVDKGRSDYGKATIRNYRRFGPGHGEPAMFDPENKRGKAIEKRRREGEERRGVKGAKVPAYKKEEVIGEEGYDKMRDDRLVKYGIGHDGSDRKGSVRYHSRPDTPEQKKRKQAASDQAYKNVVDKLRKRYPGGVMTSSRKFRDGKEVK